METEWRVIEGVTNKYGHVYMVSNKGDVINKSKDKILSTRNKYNTYGRVAIGGSEYRVNRLVALAFIPNPDNKEVVNHIDGVKSNNNLENLEWATYSENAHHAYVNNLKKALTGSNNPRSILTKDDVFEIWLNFYDIDYITSNFGLKEDSVKNLLKRTSWKHLIEEFDSEYVGVYEKNIADYNDLKLYSNKKKCLSDDEALELYFKSINNNTVLANLAREYKVSEATVNAIKYRKTRYINRILKERGIVQ